MTEGLARRQFRRRHKGPPRERERPEIAKELRALYLEPIICWPFLNQPLGPMDGLVFGLIGYTDMAGYAAHFAAGCPWFTTQGPFLRSIAPPSLSDPLVMPRNRMKIPMKKRLKLKLRPPAPRIFTLDRLELRRKYLEIAERYLAGRHCGFYSHRFFHRISTGSHIGGPLAP